MPPTSPRMPIAATPALALAVALPSSDFPPEGPGPDAVVLSGVGAPAGEALGPGEGVAVSPGAEFATVAEAPSPGDGSGSRAGTGSGCGAGSGSGGGAPPPAPCGWSATTSKASPGMDFKSPNRSSLPRESGAPDMY